MEITEVRIKLTEDSDDRLQAFCSITFDDCFVVRDLKIIEGTNGPFVAMPSRKLTSHCPRCGSKNHLRANYCNQCGVKLNTDRAVRDHEGRAKLYADIAHPINSECREMIQEHVITEFRNEIELAKEPGYTSRYEDDYDDDFAPVEMLDDEAPSKSSNYREEASFKRSDAQQKSNQPRGPHTSLNRQDEKQAGGPHGDPSRRNQDFGAGIFDD